MEMDAGSVDELPYNGSMKELTIGENKIVISKIKNEYFSMAGLCSHYNAPLVKGVLSKSGTLVCPFHGACFDVTTGAIEDGPACDSLPTYPVRVENGRLMVKVTEAQLTVKKLSPIPKVVKHCGAQKTVVIVGGGEGGAVCAESLRRYGFNGKVIVLSKEPYLPIDRPKLSKGLGVDAAKIALRDDAFYKSNKIDIRLGQEVKSMDLGAKQVILSTSETISYDYVVVATGSVPKKIPIPGADAKNVFTLRSVSDAQSIEAALSGSQASKKKVVLVGAGFVGLELASVLGKTADVTVVAPEKVLFEPVLGKEMGRFLLRLHESQGIKFKLGNGVKSFNVTDSLVTSITTNSGESVPADLVIIGIGAGPVTTMVPPELLLPNKSISVTAELQSLFDSSVYAIGDIATFPYHASASVESPWMMRIEHVSVAQNHGRLAAKNIVAEISGQPLERFVTTPYFWTAQGGKSIRYAGVVPPDYGFDEVVVQGDVDGDLDKISFAVFYGRLNKVVAVGSVGRDPVVSKCASLWKANVPIPSIEELQKGADVLSVEEPNFNHL
ncbi:hypothetical protein SmJEL517_g05032 [Synchytrium microbalum]|uniref:Rieske domain-containing protein n=1 Tax=Synchytrium microbalum TaxID=1806994 RepID=A0A507C164_9FUNG|nr:uncharacterized protein SmJEL517_g05032 [Synchytrium microbalum]TPX31726.1 hypothetical protein SmJEL517_g05032 [Synchytrium microbalum]